MLGAAAREDDRLPGRAARDARALVELGLVGTVLLTVSVVEAGMMQMHSLVQDQVAGDFSGAVRIGLAVANQDLDIVVSRSSVLEPVGEQLPGPCRWSSRRSAPKGASGPVVGRHDSRP